VRDSEQFRRADAAGKLIRIPTGDGVALAFFTSPDAPVRCAIEVSKAVQNSSALRLRMGIHSGPVDKLSDLNERSNLAGTGINMAQRIMNCGDAGHILLSQRS
jgi:class 3 adenylate cyclase